MSKKLNFGRFLLCFPSLPSGSACAWWHPEKVKVIFGDIFTTRGWLWMGCATLIGQISNSRRSWKMWWKFFWLNLYVEWPFARLCVRTCAKVAFDNLSLQWIRMAWFGEILNRIIFAFTSISVLFKSSREGVSFLKSNFKILIWIDVYFTSSLSLKVHRGPTSTLK